jgi:hypothetical protein
MKMNYYLNYYLMMQELVLRQEQQQEQVLQVVEPLVVETQLRQLQHLLLL